METRFAAGRAGWAWQVPFLGSMPRLGVRAHGLTFSIEISQFAYQTDQRRTCYVAKQNASESLTAVAIGGCKA